MDTTAAGDCFNAAFAVALVEGGPRSRGRLRLRGGRVLGDTSGSPGEHAVAGEVEALVEAKGSVMDILP